MQRVPDTARVDGPISNGATNRYREPVVDGCERGAPFSPNRRGAMLLPPSLLRIARFRFCAESRRQLHYNSTVRRRCQCWCDIRPAGRLLAPSLLFNFLIF